jgi:hypothetical protein
MVVCALVFGACEADAKRRRGRSAKKKSGGPPVVVVLPFEGLGKQGAALGKSLSLELELVDGIKVDRGTKLKRDIKNKKANAFERKTLQKLMKKRKTAIVLRGVAGWTTEGDEVVWLVGYGSDGRPRFFEPFIRTKDTDALAQQMGGALDRKLAKFDRRKVVTVSFPDKPKDQPKGDADLFVDEKSLDKDKQRASKDDDKKKGKKKSRALAEIRAEKADDDKKLDDDSPQTADEEEKKKRLQLSDEDKNREQRLAKDDQEEGAAAGDDEPDLSHLIAVSGGLGGGAWIRQFSAQNPVQSEPLYFFFPAGAHLRVSFWPIEWVGVDVDANAHGVALFHDSPDLQVDSPVLGLRSQVGLALKARYILHLGSFGIGGGVRLTGRYLGQFVPEQRANDGDLFTLFPQYHFYGAGLGAELFVSVVVFGNRIEIEPRLDIIPAAQMLEFPDWPGKSSLTVGAHAQNVVRAEIFYGVFGEFTTWATATGTNWFGGAGTRRGRLTDPISGRRGYVTGGLAVNVDTGAQLGLGWMW